MKTFTLQNCTNELRYALRKKSIMYTAILMMSLGIVQSLQAQVVYAIQQSADPQLPGNLISFNAPAPATQLTTVPITGIATGQVFEGLDFRPATGQLYALGYRASTGETQVYTIKTTTGVATPIGAAITLATSMTNLSFDFNPTVDRIRLASRTRQNYRLNPNDGTLAATDGTLTYAAAPEPNAGATPQVATVAYTNSFLGASTTTLYYYDLGLNTIGNINPPNNGILNTVGSSGIAVNNATGLDLDISTNQNTGVNTAYLSADVSGTVNNFYSVNLATGAATLIGAIGGGKITEMAVSIPAPVHSRIVYAVQGSNLITFNSAAPAVILSSTAISGLGVSESILGMDFRPATGQLYALGSLSRLYTIDLITATATQVGTNGAFTLNGTKFGFDFNPVPDRIRVVSDADQNLRLNPNDGTLAANDGTLAYVAGDANAAVNPNVGAVAYSNSYGGATATTEYFYDFSLQISGIVSVPNNGTLSTIGSSGNTFLPGGLDMDIASDQVSGMNAAFLSANVSAAAPTNFYRLNLATGGLSLLGAIGSTTPISAMAVYIPPVAPVKRVYALTSTGNLIAFNSNAPTNIISTMGLSGIVAGQVVEGLDFRPVNNTLYAIGYNNSTGLAQLYTVSTATGVAAAVGSTITLPANMGRLAMDFNPMVDRIRLISSTGQNFRINPADGALTTDTPLFYAATDVRAGGLPEVHAAAYINNYASAPGTKLYYYDFRSDNFDTTALPNNGMINTIGFTGISTATTGIDLDIATNQATGVNTAFLAANTSGTATNLYTVDLATGEARIIGAIGSGLLITEMAVAVSDAALPITLTQFAVKKSGATSQLSWLTQNELNNQYYILERSADGRTFNAISDKIISKAGNGTSNFQLSYSFTDVAPDKGVNYYRLLQADKDGSIKYSAVLKVVFDGSFEINIYPNPVMKVINMKGYFSQTADVNVRLSDAVGRIIMSLDYKKQNGNWNSQINVERLQAGTYFLQISDGKTVIHTQQVFKN